MFSSKLQVGLRLTNRMSKQLNGVYVDGEQQQRFYATKKLKVKLVEIRCFVSAMFKTVGLSKSHAETMSQAIVEADLRGHHAQGIYMLPEYLKAVKSKTVNANGQPEIIHQTPATAWVTGMNTLGPVVGKFSMKVAIKKAKECGIGVVCARCSNNFGIASYYCLQAMNQCMIGIAMSNGNPVMVPPGAYTPMLGENPIAVGAQVSPNDRFLWDMATTQVSLGRIRECLDNKAKIPKTWALDKKNKPTTDPAAALKAKKLMPFGEFKGYGFALMVDVLTGVLADANYGNKLSEKNKRQNIGQIFIAIDPKKFAPHFEARLSDYLNLLRKLPSACKGKKVLVPGDIEEERACKALNNGVSYTCAQLKIMNDLAALYCMPSIALM